MKNDKSAAVNSRSAEAPKLAFLNECVLVSISNLLPLKKLRASVKSGTKYQQILASVREVGLVEPPVVSPIPKQMGHFFLLDGHLRIEALKDIGETQVECLVSLDDDTYTYNKRISRLSAVQNHKMIVRAMERGVSPERLGRALGLSPETIVHRFRMLNGICDEAARLLSDTSCPAKVFNILRQMKPIRQIEVAELMTGNKNYSVMFANALLSATPAKQLAVPTKTPSAAQASPESMARMERELAALQMQVKAVEDSYGPDVLHLTVIRGYVAKLLASAAVVRWLAKHQPDYLREFQNIAEMSELPTDSEVSRAA